MTNEEATIEALQSRVRYLEAHLHLALQVLQQMEQDASSPLSGEIFEQQFGRSPQNQTIAITPTSKIELPTFLDSRTWGQEQCDVTQVRDRGDRAIRHLKVS